MIYHHVSFMFPQHGPLFCFDLTLFVMFSSISCTHFSDLISLVSLLSLFSFHVRAVECKKLKQNSPSLLFVTPSWLLGVLVPRVHPCLLAPRQQQLPSMSSQQYSATEKMIPRGDKTAATKKTSGVASICAALWTGRMSKRWALLCLIWGFY